jgi:hypothetical protein
MADVRVDLFDLVPDIYGYGALAGWYLLLASVGVAWAGDNHSGWKTSADFITAVGYAVVASGDLLVKMIRYPYSAIGMASAVSFLSYPTSSHASPDQIISDLSRVIKIEAMPHALAVFAPFFICRIFMCISPFTLIIDLISGGFLSASSRWTLRLSFCWVLVTMAVLMVRSGSELWFLLATQLMFFPLVLPAIFMGSLFLLVAVFWVWIISRFVLGNIVWRVFNLRGQPQSVVPETTGSGFEERFKSVTATIISVVAIGICTWKLGFAMWLVKVIDTVVVAALFRNFGYSVTDLGQMSAFTAGLWSFLFSIYKAIDWDEPWARRLLRWRIFRYFDSSDTAIRLSHTEEESLIELTSLM